MSSPEAVTSLVATEVATPLGLFSVMASPDGVVRAAMVGGLASAQRQLPRDLARLPVRQGDLRHVHAAFDDWLAGDANALTRVPVSQPGGEFTQRAWAAMREIPGGEVVTYAELAALAGNARAMRAAGQACARNRVMPFVPCHRVVAVDGLGNYGPGPELKARMLEVEGALLGAFAPVAA